jgi:hypothetical protein
VKWWLGNRATRCVSVCFGVLSRLPAGASGEAPCAPALSLADNLDATCHFFFRHGKVLKDLDTAFTFYKKV